MKPPNEKMLKRSSLSICLWLIFLAVPAWAGPRVALVYTTEQQQELETGERDPLRDYRSAIVDNGGEVIAFRQGESSVKTNRKLAWLDGVLIPGGIDVDPKFYDEPRHEKLEKTDVRLDELEFAILRYADEQELPVLGICRGEQLMNVHYGGSLIQDIPSCIVKDATVAHRFPKSSKEAREHKILLSQGSRLHELLGVDEIVVNTYHHQAVNRLGEGLVVSGRSEDGIVEAIEMKGDRFVLGVQFHPEKIREERSEFNRIFEAFIEASALGTP